ncbi:MAG: GPW/gp25 family protein [Bacteroidia bacterium]|nr:GPW/gp25 family protein [Bacteroidia bacterium]
MPNQLDDIIKNIRHILSTSPGERIKYPEYGCDLSVLASNPATEKTINFSVEQITKSLERFEPEIKVERVTINNQTAQDGFMIIEIIFRILSSKIQYQFTHIFRLVPSSTQRTKT